MDKLFHMSACFAKLGYLPYGGPNTVLCFTIGSNCIWTILTIVDIQELHWLDLVVAAAL